MPIGGYDLYRLTRGLGLPWRAVAELEQHRNSLFEGFRLDRGSVHHSFLLRRHDSGACRFLLDLDGHRRCGVHALRPAPCRVYPLVQGGELGEHAVCPDGLRQRWAAAGAAGAHAETLADDTAERVLYGRVRERWDLAAMRIPVERPLDADRFIEFLDGVYGAIDPLRSGARAAWEAEAARLIDEFPLP